MKRASRCTLFMAAFSASLPLVAQELELVGGIYAGWGGTIVHYAQESHNARMTLPGAFAGLALTTMKGTVRFRLDATIQTEVWEETFSARYSPSYIRPPVQVNGAMEKRLYSFQLAPQVSTQPNDRLKVLAGLNISGIFHAHTIENVELNYYSSSPGFGSSTYTKAVKIENSTLKTVMPIQLGLRWGVEMLTGTKSRVGVAWTYSFTSIRPLNDVNGEPMVNLWNGPLYMHLWFGWSVGSKGVEP